MVQELVATGNTGSASVTAVLNLVKAHANDDGYIFLVSSTHKTVWQEWIKKLNGHFLRSSEKAKLGSPTIASICRFSAKRKVYPFDDLVLK